MENLQLTAGTRERLGGRLVVTRDALERLGVSGEQITRYCAEGTLSQVGEAGYERTEEFERRLAERCNVGRGYLLAVGVPPATIADWLRRKVLARGTCRGFYTMSRAAFESVRAAARGTGLPRELEGLLAAASEEEAATARELAPAPAEPQSAVPPAPAPESPAAPNPTTATRLRVVPCTISRARAFVDEHHRHLPAPVSGLFAVGLAQGDALVGVAIVGRPVARALQDGGTAEVTRVCTLGHPNACSMLLGACRRVARSLGYRRLVSYTLESEPGTSLRAAGWRETAAVRGRSWNCPSRPRQPGATNGKRRWEASLDRSGPGPQEVA